MVNLCPHCIDENGRPSKETQPDFVGIPTTSMEDNPTRVDHYGLPVIEALILLKVNATMSSENIAKDFQQRFPLGEGCEWDSKRVDRLWKGSYTVCIPQLTRDFVGVPVRDILEKDGDGNLTNRILDEYILDNSEDFSAGFIDSKLHANLDDPRGGGSANREYNPAFRVLFPKHNRSSDTWTEHDFFTSMRSTGKKKSPTAQAFHCGQYASCCCIFSVVL